VTLRPEFGTVLDVLDDDTCNVQGDDGSVYAAEVYATGYTPARNDKVLVDFVGTTAVIVGARGSTRPRVPTIFVQDTNPSGSRYRQLTASWQDTTAADDVPTLIMVRSSPPDPPATSPAGPIAPTMGGTWDEVNGWDGGDVIQGQVSEFPHPRTGLWLYPPLTDARTPAGVSIRVHRKVGSGPGGNVSLRFFLHGNTSPPAGPPTLFEDYDGGGSLTLSPDATTTFPLPAEWAALLAAGTRKGVGISSTAPADYCRCDGTTPSGDLTFTFAS
jgi:hypothetical protein